jgi:Domain of unknown function (DUF6265)
MKDSKDIFDLFKDNEHKLNQPPSPRAWDRLEARLDNRRQQLVNPGRAPKLLRNLLSMAAVLLLLVACISALSILFKTKTEKTAMANTHGKATFTVEEIGLYSDQNKIAYNISTYQKQLSRLNTNPMLEGDPSKELRVQKAVFAARKDRSREMDYQNNLNPRDKQLAMQTQKQVTPENALLNVPASAATGTSTKDINTVYADGQSEGPDDEAKIFMSDSDAELITFNAFEEKPAYSLGQFDWLLGRWEVPEINFSYANTDAAKRKQDRTTAPTAAAESKGATTGLQSFEEWTRRDGGSLSGSGYVVKNGQEIFVEQMRIEQVGSDLYYVFSFPEQNVERRYALQSFDTHEIVFENKSLSFPNQVILRPESGGNQLTIVLQNSSPVLIDAKMRAYFEQRNEISPEQIKRVMSKMK